MRIAPRHPGASTDSIEAALALIIEEHPDWHMLVGRITCLWDDPGRAARHQVCNFCIHTATDAVFTFDNRIGACQAPGIKLCCAPAELRYCSSRAWKSDADLQWNWT